MIVANHFAEKLLIIIAIRGYVTFVDKQLTGVIAIMNNDAISRQEALDEWNRLSERGRTEFDQVLMMLPSAQLSNSISRQDAIDIINVFAERFNRYIGTPNDSEVYAYARGLLLSIESDIRALPSAQPEIVRCKECINHGKEICYFWSHFYGTINTPDDGFCHKSERRTDG